jgi:hypothetical protein
VPAPVHETTVFPEHVDARTGHRMPTQRSTQVPARHDRSDAQSLVDVAHVHTPVAELQVPPAA